MTIFRSSFVFVASLVNAKRWPVRKLTGAIHRFSSYLLVLGDRAHSCGAHWEGLILIVKCHFGYMFEILSY